MAATLVWILVLLAGAAVSAETLGSIASIEDFPSLAQVEKHVSLTWVQHCAAVIITNHHVISTASCVSGVISEDIKSRIRVGTSQRSDGGEVFGVQESIAHEDFGILGLDADIAVIVLDGYLTLGPKVQQAAILGQGIELPAGLTVQHAGWGTTAEGGDISSDDLYSVDLYVNNNDRCLIQYFGSQIVTENMVCVGLAYTSGRDLDELDHGAPLYYSNTLVGLFSFGKRAGDEYPAVATAIGSYTDWIIETAKS